ncbi:Protein CBG25437 [Caenorhabditis briggsae]|uniref:Protein CBG25437 n=1 Tax=Caenorhabditis briggsae TaxID=6238 RepID=B6ILD0_CAEBR|nr:Protein CBG25437 [Caenorhabditis briggsae]CAS00710.1 Protein CBG25437 [Caenorhabditis briggsae]
MMKKWPMELHKYCVDLFRTTPDLEMIMHLSDSSDLHESQTIKNLYLHSSYEYLDARIAEEFLEKANIQNSLTLIKQDIGGFTMIVCGDFQNGEGLLDGIQTSRWDPEKRPARYVLKLTGKQAFQHRNILKEYQ